MNVTCDVIYECPPITCPMQNLFPIMKGMHLSSRRKNPSSDKKRSEIKIKNRAEIHHDNRFLGNN